MELEEDVVMLYDCMFLHFYIAFNTIAFEVVFVLSCPVKLGFIWHIVLS